MCKAQAIIDELVSIGQVNRKDNGSTKECKWGTRVGMIYTFVVDILEPLFVVPPCSWNLVWKDGGTTAMVM